MKPYRIPKWLEVVFIGAIFALIFGGYAFFRIQQQSMRGDVERNLLAVAQVKIDQITSWRENQLAEGVELMSSVYLKRGIQDWLQRRDEESEEIIRARMQALVEHYGYRDILFLTPDSRQLMSYSGQRIEIHPEMSEAFTQARESSQPILSALHGGEDFDFPHIFLTVPMALEDENQTTLLGFFLLVLNANDYLYPLIQSWPLPSETAETLLVQRDGDFVLYLNELRHLKDTALSLRIPLTKLDVPAIKAIHGATGIVDGQDYRGTPVIAAVLPVPDTEWFMISKIDKTEALAVWRTNAVFIILMILGAVGTAGGFTGILWQRSAQHRLEQSEKKFRTFFESSPTAISLTGRDGMYIGVNRAYCEMTGYSEEEIVGKPATNFTHPEDRKSFEERMSISLSGKEADHRIEKRLVTKKGEIIWVSGNTNLISDSQGIPLYFLSHMLNITNQKEAEEELKLSEERFRMLAESAPEGIFVQSNLEFVYVNPAAVKLLGAKKREELLNTPMLERFVPGVRNEVKSRIQETLSGKSRAEPAERRCIRMNGEEFDAEVSASYFSWEGNEGSLVFIRDISERKQAELELQERNEFIQTILDNLPIGIAVNSVASGVDFKYMNDKFLEFYRTTREALAQTDSFWEAVYEDEKFREEMRHRVIDDTSSGDNTRMQWDDIPIQRKSEKTTYISARNIPIQRNELMVSVVWDTTHRKEAEEAIRELNASLEKRVEQRTHELREAQERLLRQERLAVLGQLAGSVSHELRNPLGVISNSIYLLTFMLKDADQKTKEYLEMIREETRRSEKIIADMLNFTKVSTPDARAFQIDEIIQSVLERTNTSDKIKVVNHIGKDLPMAYADPLQVSQVLINLVTNAYQAMTDGGQIAISTSRQTQEGKIFIQVEIKDSGAGMTEEVLSKIYEPLFTTKPRGIGLGLPLSKSLIEANGGQIEVESKPGLGSTFTLYIPAYTEEEK